MIVVDWASITTDFYQPPSREPLPMSQSSFWPHRLRNNLLFITTCAALATSVACSKPAPQEAPPAAEAEGSAESAAAAGAVEVAAAPQVDYLEAPASLNLRADRPSATVVILAKGLGEPQIDAATCHFYGGRQRSVFSSPSHSGNVTPDESNDRSAISTLLRYSGESIGSSDILERRRAAGHGAGYFTDRSFQDSVLAPRSDDATPENLPELLRIVATGGPSGVEQGSLSEGYTVYHNPTDFNHILDPPEEAEDEPDDEEAEEPEPLPPLAGIFGSGPFPSSVNYESDYPAFSNMGWQFSSFLAGEHEGQFLLFIDSNSLAIAGEQQNMEALVIDLRELMWGVDNLRTGLDSLGIDWTVALIGDGEPGDLIYHGCDTETLEPDAVFLDTAEADVLPSWYIWSSHPLGELPERATLDELSYLLAPAPAPVDDEEDAADEVTADDDSDGAAEPQTEGQDQPADDGQEAADDE